LNLTLHKKTSGSHNYSVDKHGKWVRLWNAYEQVLWSVGHVLKSIVHCITRTVKTQEDGFVLIAVIWIAGLLAVTATAFLSLTTSQIFLARNVSESVLLDGAASGMATLASFELAQSNPMQRSPQWQSCSWNADITVNIRIQDQGGLVDLNTANPDLMLALLSGLTRNPQRARKIYAEIQDFKDPDQLSSSGGQEPAQYDGKSYGPKDAPFETPFELDQIPSLSDDEFIALQYLVTVQSQQSGLDLAIAPRELVVLLKAGIISGVDVQQFNTPSAARIYAIEAIATRKGGGVFERRTVINLLRQPEKPFAILEWRRANSIPNDQSTPKPERPCFNVRS
jgi:general secretion pathway protein K